MRFIGVWAGLGVFGLACSSGSGDPLFGASKSEADGAVVEASGGRAAASGGATGQKPTESGGAPTGGASTGGTTSYGWINAPLETGGDGSGGSDPLTPDSGEAATGGTTSAGGTTASGGTTAESDSGTGGTTASVCGKGQLYCPEYTPACASPQTWNGCGAGCDTPCPMLQPGSNGVLACRIGTVNPALGLAGCDIYCNDSVMKYRWSSTQCGPTPTPQ